MHSAPTNASLNTSSDPSQRSTSSGSHLGRSHVEELVLAFSGGGVVVLIASTNTSLSMSSPARCFKPIAGMVSIRV